MMMKTKMMLLLFNHRRLRGPVAVVPTVVNRMNKEKEESLGLRVPHTYEAKLRCATRHSRLTLLYYALP